MRNYLLIPSLVLMAISCSRIEKDSSVSMQSVPVLFALDTKSLGPGEHTFRATLMLQRNNSWLSEGTYCSEYIDHSETVENGRWLYPCRVNSSGQPLKNDGTEASGLDEADKSGAYGLRTSGTNDVKLVISSPAKVVSKNGSRSYYPWTATTDTDIYVSDPVSTTTGGMWLGGQYVFPSSTMTLKNRRSLVYVHIECGELNEAYLQKVELLHCVTSARWYLDSGFSSTDNNYSFGSYTLYDCTVSNAGVPMHLIKASSQSWTSTTDVYLPSIDYSDTDFTAFCPQMRILMGDSTLHPSEVLVDITKQMDPMKVYTYNLYVSKSNIIVTLHVNGWDDVDAVSSDDTEPPAYLGTFSVSDWTEDVDISNTTTNPWNESF